MILVYERVQVPQQVTFGYGYVIAWPTGVVGTPVAAGTAPRVCGHALAVNPCSRSC